MALKIFEKFSPRANPADTNYPFGSIKNESVPGAKDGTPLDASWGNDMLGSTDALLDEAGITPNGLPDTVQSSQRLDASSKIHGRVMATLADAVASTSLSEGVTIRVNERELGSGGGGVWHCVLASTVTPNTFNIVACTGIPTLALVLQNVKYPGATKIEEYINPRQWGARAEVIGAVTGFDNSPVAQAIVDHVTSNAGAEIEWGDGAFYFASTVNIPTTDTGGLGQNGCVFKGTGRKTTELFTDQDIDMFTHADRLVVRDLSVVQRSEATNKWKGVAFRANGQCRFCAFENVEIWWFKFGNLQRFSLWNSYRDVYYVDNVCGIKLARSNDLENVNNPSPAGFWNAGDGWFHNQNTFENIVFNGGSKVKNEGRGEIGFWGAVQGSSFSNITVQNYNRDGSNANVTLPPGEGAKPMVIAGGGPTSSATFNNHIEGLYFEVNHNGLHVEDNRKLTVTSWFVQGQAASNVMLEVHNSKVKITGQTGQTPGYATRMSLTGDSFVSSDGELVASGATDTIEVGSYYTATGIDAPNGAVGSQNRPLESIYLNSGVFLGGSMGQNNRLSIYEEGDFTGSLEPETSGTITVDPAADLCSYTRIGRLVTVNSRIDLSAVSSPVGSYIEFGELPFPVDSVSERAGSAGGGQVIMLTAGVPVVLPVIFLESATTARWYVDASTLAGIEQFYFTLSYITV